MGKRIQLKFLGRGGGKKSNFIVKIYAPALHTFFTFLEIFFLNLINGYIGNITKKKFLINFFFFHYLPRSEIKIIPEMAKDFKKNYLFLRKLEQTRSSVLKYQNLSFSLGIFRTKSPNSCRFLSIEMKILRFPFSLHFSLPFSLPFSLLFPSPLPSSPLDFLPHHFYTKNVFWFVFHG